jgi:hypothetical protein
LSHKSPYLFRSSALGLALCVTLGVNALSIKPSTPEVVPTKSPEPLDRTPLTFVQITDLHLFDAGIKANNKSDAEREQSESREALRWAIAGINHLIDSGVDISFVVFSGDLGLYAVRSPDQPVCNANEDADYNNARSRGWPALLIPLQAAKELAGELKGLQSKTLYFVPGNNDLAGEDPCDLGRYKDLIRETAKAISGSGPELVDLSAITVAESPQYGQYRLIGLNSASFKNPKDTSCYKPSRPDQTSTGKVDTPVDPQRTPGCPEFESNKLLNLGDTNAYLIFTHVPDLQDPWQQSQHPECKSTRPDAENDRCDSWNSKVDWSQLRSNLRRPNVAAIFAGHFHDSDRQIYATRADTTSLPVPADSNLTIAAKTWVTPPLSIKNQLGKPTTARGFLLVHIQGWAGEPPHLLVSVVPFWYAGFHSCQQLVMLWIRWLLWVLIAVMITIALLTWHKRARRRGDDPWDTYRKVLLHPVFLTALALVIAFLVTWKTMEFITTHMSIPFAYWLVPIFGAMGGVVGGLLRSDNRIILCRYEQKGQKEQKEHIEMGVVGDILIGIGGATSLVALFGNTLSIPATTPSGATLLISLSFVAGVFGRAVVLQAGKKLLSSEEKKEVAREAAEEVTRQNREASKNP